MNAFIDHMDVMAEFHAGNPAAEKFIFKKFYKPLCLFADNIVDDTQASEDIVTDVIIKAYNKRTEFHELENIKAFLYISVRNAAINFSKAKKRHKEIQKEAGVNSPYSFDMTDNAFLNEMYKVELIQEIFLEIENLPGKCRTVFELMFFKGLSSEEIAKQLSINQQTVRTQKARALQLIRTRLFEKNKLAAISLLIAYLNKLL